MTGPASPQSIIAALLDRSDGLEAELAEALDLPASVVLDDVLSGAHPLTPSDLIAASDVLGVPVTVLTGDVPMDRHLGVSLRMGRFSEALGVQVAALDALDYVDTVLGHQAVLDSWLGPVTSPLAGVSMHTGQYRIGAGAQSADRVRRVLGLGSGPIEDLVGLVERLGYSVVFRELPEDMHGLNVRDERGGAVARVIVISTRGGWPMQRYTLGHELCHALYDDPGQVIVDRVEVPDMLTERRAEAFARELLLPRRGLAADVRAATADRLGWAGLTARIMVRWGLSRDAVVRSLVDDGHATEADVAPVRAARVRDLIQEAGLAEQWREVCGDEHVEAGSPMLVDRAVRAYGNGWISSWVVADLLGEDHETTERRLIDQGWRSPEAVSG